MKAVEACQRMCEACMRVRARTRCSPSRNGGRCCVAAKQVTHSWADCTAAERAITQARRCEQLVFRLGLLGEESRSQEKRLKYYSLNKDAARGINKHICKLAWEKTLEEETRVPEQIATNTLVVPMLRRCAEKYHEEAIKQKAKA